MSRPPDSRSYSQYSPLLIGLAAGVLALSGCGSRGGGAAEAPIPDEPVPAAFDYQDPRQALHWWVATRDRAPGPPAGEAGNPTGDKPPADWEAERQKIASARPIRWKVRITLVTDKGEAALDQIEWPFRTKDEYYLWLGEKKADWTFPAYVFRIRRPPARVNDTRFPFADPAWAKTVGKGAEAILAGTIQSVDEDPVPGVEYEPGKSKAVTAYWVNIQGGRIEKP